MERAGQRHLTRPLGARTVDAFFDEHEARYPVIDNFADEGAGLVHGLAAEGTADLGAAAPALLRYILFRMPWQQFRLDLDAGDVQPPVWDLDAALAQGPALLVEFAAERPSVQATGAACTGGRPPDRADGRTERRRDRGPLRLPGCLAPRPPAFRAGADAVRSAGAAGARVPAPAGQPRRGCSTTSGARATSSTAGVWKRRRAARPPPPGPSRCSSTTTRTWSTARQSVLELTRLGRTVIVHGFSPVRNALSPVVINGGPWQRTITPVAVRPPAGRARSLRRRAAGCPAAGASRALLRLRADRSLRGHAGSP